MALPALDKRMCQLAGVSKSGFYRHLRTRDTHDEEMHVRSAIQHLALEHEGRYGYRRITAELRRAGMLVNHKRVARIVSEDNRSEERRVGKECRSRWSPYH